MKNLYIKLICTAAIIAALPLAGCSNMNKGKETTSSDVEISQMKACEADEDCPNGDCDDKGDCGNDCPDGDCDGDKDDCPDKGDCDGDKRCPNKRRKHIVLPRGKFHGHRKPHVPPKLPVEPPEDDDIILPDPPVDNESPKN